MYNKLINRLTGTIGIAGLLHDSNDIALEGAKLLFHFRYQHGQINPFYAGLAHITGRLLLISWFITRIYYYPHKILIMSLDFPEYTLLWFLGVQLWIMFAMNIFWFTVNCANIFCLSILISLYFSGSQPTIGHFSPAKSLN